MKANRRNKIAAKRRRKGTIAKGGAKSAYAKKRGIFREAAASWWYRGTIDDDMVARTKRDVEVLYPDMRRLRDSIAAADARKAS